MLFGITSKYSNIPENGSDFFRFSFKHIFFFSLFTISFLLTFLIRDINFNSGLDLWLLSSDLSELSPLLIIGNIIEDIYLTTSETSKIFKFPKQTLYNLINKGVLIKGVHYFKPVPKKLLFSKNAMKMWVESSGNMDNDRDQSLQISLSTNPNSIDKCLINI